ncbi:hypothetical protein, partial [Brevibacillus sp. MCWH]|uniref:hypothetical protein n=1 Tax=Brevibacillus sp. MCWH TaxID=2508871 RepID=UPI001490E5B1
MLFGNTEIKFSDVSVESSITEPVNNFIFESMIAMNSMTFVIESLDKEDIIIESFIKDSFEKVKKIIIELWKKITSWFNSALNFLKSIFSKVFPFFKKNETVIKTGEPQKQQELNTNH